MTATKAFFTKMHGNVSWSRNTKIKLDTVGWFAVCIVTEEDSFQSLTTLLWDE